MVTRKYTLCEMNRVSAQILIHFSVRIWWQAFPYLRKSFEHFYLVKWLVHTIDGIRRDRFHKKLIEYAANAAKFQSVHADTFAFVSFTFKQIPCKCNSVKYTKCSTRLFIIKFHVAFSNRFIPNWMSIYSA